MAELIEITRAMELVYDFNPIQRIMLLCAGTLQSTLTSYFRTEVTVQVVHQSEGENESSSIKRGVVLKAGDAVLCTAESTIYLDRQDIRQEVLEQKVGIGQILQKLDVPARFRLLTVKQEEDTFRREYELKGLGITYWISEVFPNNLYQYQQCGDGPAA